MTPSPPSRTRCTVALLMLLAYAGLIFRSSSGPVPPVVVSLGAPDVLLHVVEYAVLGFLTSRWLRLQTRGTGWLLLVVLPGLLSVAYGGTDELHQAFVDAREASAGDLLADAVGGFLGAVAYKLGVTGWPRGPRRPAS